MKEIFNVSLHPDGLGFTMHLSIGDIDIPYQYGMRVVSTGCGTGKTECCKSIIRQLNQYGILYCTDSVAGAHTMYEWIMENACDIGISSDEVMVITSKGPYSGQLEYYRDNPEAIMQKKVLIITHPRFFSDLINLFLIYHPQMPVEEFDGDFATLLSRTDLRKYVLFDETPNFITPFLTISKLAAGLLTADNSNAQLKDVRERFAHYIEGLQDPLMNPFRGFSNANTKTSRLARMKRNVAFKLLPKYISRWRNDPNGKAEEITFTPADLDIYQLKSNILIFEGAGEILFHGASFPIIDFNGRKYHSRVNFTSIPFNADRKKFTDTDYKYTLETLQGLIAYNVRQGRRTLVVVWKNVNNYDGNEFWEKLNDDLIHYHFPDGSYSLTYFGAADSKGTNIYKDFDDIVLWGKWWIPQCETSKFAQHFNCQTPNTYHVFWLFVQLILRIGIRQHDSNRNFTVYHTSDYDTHFIGQLKQYLNDSKLPVVFGNGPAAPLDWLGEALKQVKVNASQHNNLNILYNNVPEIAKIIVTGTPGTVYMRLDELFNLIPMAERKTRNYNPLVKALRDLGVDLKITLS